MSGTRDEDQICISHYKSPYHRLRMIFFHFQKSSRLSEVKICYHEGHFRGMCSDFEYFTFRRYTTCVCVCVYIWCLIKSSTPVRPADRPAASAAMLNLAGFRKSGLGVIPGAREMLKALWSQQAWPPGSGQPPVAG